MSRGSGRQAKCMRNLLLSSPHCGTSTCSSSSVSTCSTGSAPGSNRKNTSSSASRELKSSPAAKWHRGTNSLTRYDILDIVATVIQVIPNSNMTANSFAGGASLQSQLLNSADSANPAIQAVLPNHSADGINPARQAVSLNKELQHQEL